MQVMVEHKRITLEDKMLLGVGGEARVYRWGDKALKIYHGAEPGLGQAEKLQVRRALQSKVSKLLEFPCGLPAQVVGPQGLVEDLKGEPVGFVMARVPGGEDVRLLAKKRWRQGVVTNQEVMGLFGQIQEVLDRLHSVGVVVGDLNDANVLFTLDGGIRPWFIDADSMHFGQFPCVVGHERFLDPRLYGLDLSQGALTFSPESDWYAFGVLLFASLLYVHPYGGVHRQYPTLLRRAEARHSLLRDDVRVPKAAVSPWTLPEPLLAWFRQVFDEDHRGRPDRSLLDVRWEQCGCGVVHGRDQCPVCKVSVAVIAMPPPEVRRVGRLQVRRCFQTRGRLLQVALQGGLKYVYEEGGVVYREDGGEVMTQPPEPGMRFEISGASTWIGWKGRLVEVRREQAVRRVACSTVGGQAAFAVNSRACYRVDGTWLVHTEEGLRVGQVLEGQTWLAVGEHLGVGFYRTGRGLRGFCFRPGQGGLVPIELPPVDGRLLEARACFDQSRILLGLAIEDKGQRQNRLLLIKNDGSVEARLEGSPDDASLPMLRSLEGKAMMSGRLLCATEEGLMTLRAEGGTLKPGHLFADTESLVDSEMTLLPGSDGSIYAAGHQTIVHLGMG